MPGGSLADLLKRGRIDAARTVALGHQVALALDAHAHGVVHRDVKPDNVWLRPTAPRRSATSASRTRGARSI
jgi:serine/threonine protein kinase